MLLTAQPSGPLTFTAFLTAAASPPPPSPPPPLAPQLVDGDEAAVSRGGQIISGSLLDNDVPPTGATTSVQSFTFGGVTYTPGPTPVELFDPATGELSGALVILADGTYSFTPAPGFAGPVPAVNYTVASSDGQTNPSMLFVEVTVMLQDGNEAFSVLNNQTVSGNVLSNAVPPSGETATVQSFTLTGSTAVYAPGPTPVTVVDPASGNVTGTLTLQPDGSLTFIPAPGFAGPVPPVSYVVASSDGQTNPSAVTIDIVKPAAPVLTDGNEASLSTSPLSTTTPTGTAISGNVLSNAAASTGASVAVSSFTIAGSSVVYAPGSGPVQVIDASTGTLTGTLTLNADGSFTFAPAPGFSGPVPAITYVASSSDGLTNPSLLSIDVLPPAFPPVSDGSEAVSTPAGLPVSGSLLTNAFTPDGSSTSVTSFTLPGSDIVYTPGPGSVPVVDNSTGQPELTGSLTVLADGSFTFTPAPGFSGTVPVVSYTVKDANGGSDDSTLSISVSLPLLDGNEATTTLGSQPVSGSLLANALPPNGTTVSVASFTLPGSSVVYTPGTTPVTVTDASTGAVVGSLVVQTDGSYSFTAAVGFSGTVPPVTYVVRSSDGQTNPSILVVDVLPGTSFNELMCIAS